MKKVIKNPLLKEKMTEAISLLCDTVAETLGPKGHNVIIDHSDFTPFITNDGATIARNISSDDEITNTILELAKEASLKTNDNVGDGTTTTLVLLKSIYEAGLKVLATGYNSLILKEELISSSRILEKLLYRKSKKPNLKAIEHIASIAAGDEKIGKLLKDAYQKVGANSIFLTETAQEKTSITHTIGYQFETILASPYYLKNNTTLNITNPYLFLTSSIINDSEEIADILNYCIVHNFPLIIIAKDYSDYFLNDQLNNFLENNFNIILLKTPGYGYSEISILEDIATISESLIVSNLSNVNISTLGQVNSLSIDPKNTLLSFSPRPEINNLIKNLQANETSNEMSPDTLKRISMLTKGLITINIGAPTDTERREKKMRYEDALCALKSAEGGLLPGSGLILYELAYELNPKTQGDIIIKEALTKPLITILENAALDYKSIISQIIKENFQILYNVNTSEYENITTTKVIDPTSVVVNSLKNAISIASLLLTTNSLVINELPHQIVRENFTDM